MTVDEHMDDKALRDFAVDPEHADRRETTEFAQSKRRLDADGHYQCFICGGKDNLQAHHFFGEWMFAPVVDLEQIRALSQIFDVYGYGRLLAHKPVASVDDIRNMMVLCQPHHTGVDHVDGGGGTGIHSLTFPSWIIQRVAKQGLNPIPQQGESFAQAMQRVKDQAGAA